MRAVRRRSLFAKSGLFLMLFGLLTLGTGLVLGYLTGLADARPPAARLGLVFLTAVAWLSAVILAARLAGRRLASPIEALLSWSEDRSLDFPAPVSSRRDEIGILARSLEAMDTELRADRERLREDLRTQGYLNRIVRVEFENLPLMPSLERILGLVNEAVPALSSTVMRRDPDGGGFDLLSLTETRGAGGGTLRAGMATDGDLPGPLLVRHRDPFDLDLSATDDCSPFLAGAGPGLPGWSRLVVTNVPVEVQGSYLGSLVLVRERSKASARDFFPFAEHVYEALSFLESRDRGENNWHAIVYSLVNAVDAKSAWTKGHSERVASLATALGGRLLMGEGERDRLRIAAVLHDVGKIGIPETILDKPGALDSAEMAVVRQHPVAGARIVEDTPGYSDIRTTILHHHERWDGSGYPAGLSGEAIPLHSRIIALADVFDAITDSRPYRKGLDRKSALSYLESEIGRLFDPALTRIFIESLVAAD